MLRQPSHYCCRDNRKNRPTGMHQLSKRNEKRLRTARGIFQRAGLLLYGHQVSYRFVRPCIQCQELHRDKGDYCAQCRRIKDRAREADPARRKRKRELYNSDYRKQAAMIKASATHCHLCLKPFTDRAQITADHINAGEPNSPLAPAHKSCNSSRGNRKL